MKKTILLCFLVLLFVEGFSQKVRLGLRFAPGVAFSRVNEEIDSVDFKGKGVGVRFFGGPEVNIMMSENYVFTTGIWYMVRRAALQIENYGAEQVFNVQYLQLPATLKLYTNDIAVDTKLYFQFGGTLDIKLQQKSLSEKVVRYANRMRFFDCSALIGAGMQLQMGTNTYVFGGITYSRGLLPSISTLYNTHLYDSNGNEVQLPVVKALKNDLISLDIGIRF